MGIREFSRVWTIIASISMIAISSSCRRDARVDNSTKSENRALLERTAFEGPDTKNNSSATGDAIGQNPGATFGGNNNGNDFKQGQGENCVVIKHLNNEWGVSTLFQEKGEESYYVFSPPTPTMLSWKNAAPSEDAIKRELRSKATTAQYAVRGPQFNGDVITGGKICTGGNPRQRSKRVCTDNNIPSTITLGSRTAAVHKNGQVGTDECPLYNVTDDGWNGSPLILDFTGKGLSVSSVDDGVLFDITGKGKQRVSWPYHTQDTPWLVLDVNGNGEIDGISELFGNATPHPDGKSFANGFEALAVYDDNADGVIDERDAVFAQLALWSDLDRSGTSKDNELTPLSSRVSAISLDYVDRVEFDDAHGNETRQRALFFDQNDEAHVIYDLWLRLDGKPEA